MNFDLNIGIDYSGAQEPTTRLSTLQVYAAADGLPEPVRSSAYSRDTHRNWTRKEIADWLVDTARSGKRYIAGIDHAFSFPKSYFEQYGLTSWLEFLDDFCRHWPTDSDRTSVDSLRPNAQQVRTGPPTDLRLTEKWTSSAKSVFKFDVQGSVAKSTRAGIPWLRHIREKAADKAHFWPFEGWDVPNKEAVIAEVYPSIFKNRCPRANRTPDQQDAYAVARWLMDADTRGVLNRYLNPPLTEKERATAEFEYWILAIA